MGKAVRRRLRRYGPSLLPGTLHLTASFDRIYLMTEYVQLSVDGGSTFNRVNIDFRHGDSHAMAFKNSDPDYVMLGDDGGLYESFIRPRTGVTSEIFREPVL